MGSNYLLTLAALVYGKPLRPSISGLLQCLHLMLSHERCKLRIISIQFQNPHSLLNFLEQRKKGGYELHQKTPSCLLKGI